MTRPAASAIRGLSPSSGLNFKLPPSSHNYRAVADYAIWIVAEGTVLQRLPELSGVSLDGSFLALSLPVALAFALDLPVLRMTHVSPLQLQSTCGLRVLGSAADIIDSRVRPQGINDLLGHLPRQHIREIRLLE